MVAVVRTPVFVVDGDIRADTREHRYAGRPRSKQTRRRAQPLVDPTLLVGRAGKVNETICVGTALVDGNMERIQRVHGGAREGPRHKDCRPSIENDPIWVNVNVHLDWWGRNLNIEGEVPAAVIEVVLAPRIGGDHHQVRCPRIGMKTNRLLGAIVAHEVCQDAGTVLPQARNHRVEVLTLNPCPDEHVFGRAEREQDSVGRPYLAAVQFIDRWPLW